MISKVPPVHLITDEGRVLCRAAFPRMRVTPHVEEVTCEDCIRKGHAGSA
jgi:hypothetical protein